MKKLISWFICSLLIFMLTSSSKTTTIFVICDSTAAEKSNPQSNPERGWGMVLQGCFDGKIIVDNHAVNGRSSKSFIDEGRWKKVLDKIKAGDYVLIQFGHNDEKPAPDRHTDPETTFAANLRRYVNETRAKGGIPVLLNSVVRRCWYVEKDMNVPFVDATKITHDIETQLGVIGSRKLHMWFRPGENPQIAKGRQDNTHYNVYGAHVVANALADALAAQVPALKRHVRHYDYVVSKEGRGNFLNLQDAVDAIPVCKKTTVLVLGGNWKKPMNTKDKKIKFVKQFGAKIG